MKYFKMVLPTVLVLVMAGCGSTGGIKDGFTDSLLVERVGVRALTDRLINSADDTYVKAGRVCAVAMRVIDEENPVPIQDVAQKILTDMDIDRMSPGERAGAVEVVIYIADEINRRIQSGILQTSETAAASWVAMRAIEHAAIYNPDACVAQFN
jgi:hypothetical protein